MDPLTVIVAGMTAILFGWIGYFLGNAFPVTAKAKKAKEKRKTLKEFEGSENPTKEAIQKAIDWLLERDEEEESDGLTTASEGIDTVDQIGDDSPSGKTYDDSTSSAEKTAKKPKRVLIDTPKMAGEDAVVLWHNRRQKKLYAKVNDDIFDLDSNMSQSQHGALSMLLVDLQEHVGIAATLREALEEDADKVLAEKERKRRVLEEESLDKPSFNPIRSLVNYVQSDIPKLDEQPLNIPEQIDEILQRNLLGTHLENKGISVRKWPNRGVVFIVGLDIYEDLHKVPDPEIRNEIRKAVKEWESSQEDE